MSKANILVIDDHELILEGFCRAFEGEDYTVKKTTDGNEAIKMVKKEYFDIVFTDLKMPEVSGVDVCRGIKKISPRTVIILFSGSPHEVARTQNEFLNEGGHDELLRKPLSSDEILTVTKHYIEKRDAGYNE